MPRGQKSKQKRQRARGNAQACEGAQETAAAAVAAAAEEVEVASPPAQSLPTAEPCSPPEGLQEALAVIPASEAILGTESDAGADDQDGSESTTSEAIPSTISHFDHTTTKSLMLQQLLLCRFQKRQLTTKKDMLNIITEEYIDDFAEILSRASHLLSVVFAVDVREVDSGLQTYNLISKLKLPNNGRIRPGQGFPKGGLVMNVLAMILIKGNCAREEDIWRLLKMMRVKAGKKHFIYGEPKKLLTKDLVRLNYLIYQQVADSAPPRYVFQWGPRAFAETTEAEVLKFLANINDLAPCFFSTLYEDALKEAKAAVRRGDARKRDAAAAPEAI